MKTASRIAAILISLCRLAVTASDPHFAMADDESALLAPRYSELYTKDAAALSERERWRVMIHGLRLAPLNPEIWGIRKSERTENRRLIPMRPFVLRASENPFFFFEEISIKFRFVRASERDMERKYHHKDPVIDIFFGGELEIDGHTTTRDRGYFLRITSFPEFKSGFYYHSMGAIEPLLELENGMVSTGDTHSVVLLGERDRVLLTLDGAERLVLKGSEINRGILALMTGWHPVKIEDLKVSGFILHENGRREDIHTSGLFQLAPKQKKKSGK